MKLLMFYQDITIHCHVFVQAHELIIICTDIFQRLWNSLLEDSVMANSVAAFCDKLKHT